MAALEVGKEYQISPKDLKFLKGNRIVDIQHVNRLKLAIAKENLLPDDPIIINRNKEILDGQHRTVACLQLDIETVPCIVRNGGLELAQKLNNHTRNWCLLDFAFSYASQGYKDYETFLDYHRRWGFGINECMEILAGGRRKECFANFRAGQFKVKTSEAEAAKIGNLIDDFRTLVPKRGYKSRAFVLAFLKVYRTKGYNHARMLHKLNLQPLRRCPDYSMYLEELEAIYNRQARVSDRLRFTQTE